MSGLGAGVGVRTGAAGVGVTTGRGAVFVFADGVLGVGVGSACGIRVGHMISPLGNIVHPGSIVNGLLPSVGIVTVPPGG